MERTVERTTMLRKRNIWILGFIVALALGIASHAQGDLVYLGNAHVDGSQDHDEIHVGRSAGTFRAIQLQVSGGAVEFEHVVVHYGNGTSEPIQVRQRIQSGSQTRLIELPGERRVIKSVELWYSKDNWTKRPTVSLYGAR